MKHTFSQIATIVLTVIITVLFVFLYQTYDQYFKEQKELRKENAEFRKTIKNKDSANLYLLSNDSTPRRLLNIQKCRIDSILNDSMVEVTLTVNKLDLYKSKK